MWSDESISEGFLAVNFISILMDCRHEHIKNTLHKPRNIKPLEISCKEEDTKILGSVGLYEEIEASLNISFLSKKKN